MNIFLSALAPVLSVLRVSIAMAGEPEQAALAVQPPPGDISDIYGPLPLPEAPNWPLYLGLAAAAVALLTLVVSYLRRRKSRTRQILQPQPHTEALAELTMAHPLLEENSSIAYAARVSAILRRYIENRFALRSTSQTTREFLSAVEAADSTGDSALHRHRQLLGAFLHQCDLAKYAGKSATRAQLEEMEHTLRRFIEATAEEQ
ncbi:MAG TPA: DUF4381 family protein [Desulfopila sp.]|nr:DUF4381 family protein [Desulfopila sp.]